MKVSVVMTTYNGEKYLKQQIDSILTQTFPAEELIVCDDCSSDGTVTILEQYRQKKLLTYVVNARRLGLIGNFKKAVSMAAEKNFVALCDQDDIWLPDKLAVSLTPFERMDTKLPCLVHTDLILTDERENVLNWSFKNERGQSGYKHNLQTLLFANFVTGCTVVMNPVLRHFFTDMPDDIRYHDAWIALVAYSFGIAVEIPTPTIRYRKHDNNLSIVAGTKPRNRYRSIFNELRKSFLGKDDFLWAQFETVFKFYTQYQTRIAPDDRIYFEKFLQLRHKSYFIKKIAFGSVVRKYALNTNGL
ncbi:glycosyltransferase family 2 protein [Pedobacter hartonius]|uniref:Glycosyltransferase involved in cell wall bisynthesis n=1 Tax=Pedobacter hartonius TaxID=425514 RepID=A0A1H4FQ22_9SPHI|nr:glycosyltransferase family 2 protein [Pedobacter hartonius]SEA99426.1 Glycosyltransferase involved in cell wall bisynthesis [Pedobacter hartonius]